jgi:hypothetical protein
VATAFSEVTVLKNGFVIHRRYNTEVLHKMSQQLVFGSAPQMTIHGK